MANEQFIDPGQRGPFYNLPNKSQLILTGSPWQALKDWGTMTDGNGTYGRAVLQANRTMEQFAFSSTQPTAARVELNYTDSYGYPRGPAPFYYGMKTFLPALKAVLKFSTGGTFTTNILLTTGTQYGYEMKSRSYPSGVPSSVNTFGLVPICAYIYRPSTQAVVGWLWDASSEAFGAGDWGSHYGGTMVTGQYSARPYNTQVTGFSISAPPSGFVPSGYTNASVAFQAGDYLVIEHWVVDMWYSYAASNVGLLDTLVSINGAGGTIYNASNARQNTSPTDLTWWKFVPPQAYVTPDAGPDANTVPKLTHVTPNANGLALTFDSRVDLASPVTLGDNVGGLTLQSVTESDTTHKQINVHPENPSATVGF